MEENEKKRRVDLFKDEYFHIHNIIDSFDTKSLTIKAWSVTVSMSGIGGAFISHIPVLLLLSSFSALIFWILEYYWKSFQDPHFTRINEIESYINGEKDSLEPMQIGKHWEINRKNGEFKRFLSIMRYLNVLTPHFYILLFGLIVFILHKLSWITV